MIAPPPRARRAGRARRALCAAAAIAVVARAGHAQPPARELTLGWGVDTTRAPARDVVRLWAAYLAGGPERPHASPHWLASEQARWPDYDLTRRWAYQGFAPTVVEVEPASADSGVYVVKTLFASASGADGGGVRPLALQRVYAVRTADGWRLANALPRHTAEWREEVVGPIRYRVEPGAPFDRARAEGAVRFMRALARRFGVHAPAAVDYVVARTPESMARAVGLDWTVPGTGGRAYVENRLVLSGSPLYGEAYLHELAHLVLARCEPPGGAFWLASEGAATWAGGSRGRDAAALWPELAAYLELHPALRLADVYASTSEATPVLYAAGALLVALVHERGGDRAVRELLAESRTEASFQSAAARLLGVSAGALDDAWREGARRLGRRG